MGIADLWIAGGFSTRPRGPKLKEREVVSSVARAQDHGSRKQNIVMHLECPSLGCCVSQRPGSNRPYDELV